MNSLSVLSPLTSSFRPDASIIFQGETFPIFPAIFASYSRTANEQYRFNHSEFVVTSSVTRESLQIFINICQGKQTSFDKSQILDLLSLSEEWSVDSLKAHLLSLIEKDDDQILTSLRYAIENDFATEEYETRARRRFRELVEKDELLEVPLPVLRRIVDVGLQDTDFDKLFAFLRKCLDQFGIRGSVLFQGVNLCHLSERQLRELLDRRDLNWCYLSEGVSDTLSFCIGEMSKHRTRFEEEHRALYDLQIEYARALSDLAAWKRTQDDRLSSVESSMAEFQSSLARRLSLVESNSAAKSDLEKYALKSDLESNYATQSEVTKYALKADLDANYATKLDMEKCALKSDLQLNYPTKSELTAYALSGDLETNYVAKSDLQANYATKSDFEKCALKSELESNYATKSDLHSDYLTKLDAMRLELRCASKTYFGEHVNSLARVIGGFPLIPGSPLNGIIRHLALECGGNVHDKGVVVITADRPYSNGSTFAVKNIADLEADSFFDCADAKDMWVCYDFRNMKVILTDYSIRSGYNETRQNLKSWVIEISTDGEHWTEADRRENREELHAQNVVRSFPVSTRAVSRYVRLRQIGWNHARNFDTYTSGFELFGVLTI
jgi:hypothetical protein